MTLFDFTCQKCHSTGLANTEESDDPKLQTAGEETEENSDGQITLLFCPKCLTGREHYILIPIAILSVG